MTEEEKSQYIKDYAAHEGIKLDRVKIEKNPGRRQVCKLMNNSLWGKTGQAGNQPNTKVVYTAKDFNKIVFNDAYELGIIEPLPNHGYAWQITYKLKSKYVAKEPRNTNVYVAAFTTCLARIKLWKVLHRLGERVLYYDTDSIIYVTGPGQQELERGPYLGELTDELEGRYITEFASTGPKSYAYRDNKGAHKIKFKGISKSLFNVAKVNIETMVQCIDDAVCQLPENEAKSRPFMLTGDNAPHNMLFQIDSFGRIQTKFQTKTFRMSYNKRYIGENYKTYPFGYHEG